MRERERERERRERERERERERAQHQFTSVPIILPVDLVFKQISVMMLKPLGHIYSNSKSYYWRFLT